MYGQGGVWQLQPRTTRNPDDQDQRGPNRSFAQARSRATFIRTIAQAVLQLIMQANVEGLIDAGRHERAENQPTWRMSRRPRNPCRRSHPSGVRSAGQTACHLDVAACRLINLGLAGQRSRKEFDPLRLSQAQRLKGLERENELLKRLVADSSPAN